MRDGDIVECVSANWSPLVAPRFSPENYPFEVGRYFTIRRIGRTPRSCLSDLDGRWLRKDSLAVSLWELPCRNEVGKRHAYDPRRFRVVSRSERSAEAAVVVEPVGEQAGLPL